MLGPRLGDLGGGGARGDPRNMFEESMYEKAGWLAGENRALAGSLGLPQNPSVTPPSSSPLPGAGS